MPKCHICNVLSRGTSLAPRGSTPRRRQAFRRVPVRAWSRRRRRRRHGSLEANPRSTRHARRSGAHVARRRHRRRCACAATTGQPDRAEHSHGSGRQGHHSDACRSVKRDARRVRWRREVPRVPRGSGEGVSRRRRTDARRTMRTPAAKNTCETCHGPGKAHVDADGDGHIKDFTKMAPRQVGETCTTLPRAQRTQQLGRRQARLAQHVVHDLPQRARAEVGRRPS